MKNPIDSRQLHAFATLARNGSFTQTARELFLTQSAISHSIKALERDVGCRLLDRLGKKINLTPAGEHLLGHAERILSELQSARDGLEHLSRWSHGHLMDDADSSEVHDQVSILTASSAGRNSAPPQSTSHPSIEIQTQEANGRKRRHLSSPCEKVKTLAAKQRQTSTQAVLADDPAWVLFAKGL